MRRTFVVAGALCCLPSTAQALPEWTPQGLVSPGRQFAAEVDTDDRIHIIAERYSQIDVDANVLTDEADVGDASQGPLDMYPAIAIGPDGTVHVVTRNGGSFAGGNDLRYASRPAAGGWSAAVSVGTPVARNYVVGVAAPSGGRVLVTHGRQVQDVGAAIDVYEISGGVATLLGSTPTGWLRTDADYRLATIDNAVVLASGAPGPGATDGVRFALAADANADITAQWEGTNTVLAAGAPRRGGPSLYVAEDGGIHVGYGALETHHHTRFDITGVASSEAQTMSGLGTWHLSYGNGAVVASPDGMRIVAVALENLDGDATSADANILFSESIDAGATFSAPQPTGLVTDGGEGRMRVRLFELGGTLALLYRDNAVNGIALATSPWFEEEPEGTSTGTTTDVGDDSSTSGDDPSGDTTTGPDATSGASSSSSSSGPASATGGGSGLTSGPLTPGSRGDSSEGCGCHSGPPRSLSFLAVVLLALGRRRR